MSQEEENIMSQKEEKRSKPGSSEKSTSKDIEMDLDDEDDELQQGQGKLGEDNEWAKQQGSLEIDNDQPSSVKKSKRKNSTPKKKEVEQHKQKKDKMIKKFLNEKDTEAFAEEVLKNYDKLNSLQEETYKETTESSSKPTNGVSGPKTNISIPFDAKSSFLVMNNFKVELLQKIANLKEDETMTQNVPGLSSFLKELTPLTNLVTEEGEEDSEGNKKQQHKETIGRKIHIDDAGENLLNMVNVALVEYFQQNLQTGLKSTNRPVVRISKKHLLTEILTKPPMLNPFLLHSSLKALQPQ